MEICERINFAAWLLRNLFKVLHHIYKSDHQMMPLRMSASQGIQAQLMRDIDSAFVNIYNKPRIK